MCEFDDVFHNVLGSAIGFGYWTLLLRQGDKCYSHVRSSFSVAIKAAKNNICKAKGRIKNWWKK